VGLIRVFRARYLKMKLYMISKKSKMISRYSIYEGTNNPLIPTNFKKLEPDVP
jgi:hypothetical protein